MLDPETGRPYLPPPANDPSEPSSQEPGTRQETSRSGNQSLPNLPFNSRERAVCTRSAGALRLCLQIFAARSAAIKWTKVYFGSAGIDDSRANAFKHALWNGISTLMTRAPAFVRELTTAHERPAGSVSGIEAARRTMDLNNNSVGIAAAQAILRQGPAASLGALVGALALELATAAQSGLSVQGRHLVIIRNGKVVRA